MPQFIAAGGGAATSLSLDGAKEAQSACSLFDICTLEAVRPYTYNSAGPLRSWIAAALAFAGGLIFVSIRASAGAG